MIEIIDKFFTNKEIDLLSIEIEKESWILDGFSNKNSVNPIFWYKNIFNTKIFELFLDTIQRGIKRKIIIDKLYVNGQAHGQCGYWHTDAVPGDNNCFTVVYFNKEWLPEYGGHLLIKSSPVTSILPEFNKAVLFDSTFEHMGMEPTVHCKTQRESIACKFKVIA
jgi:hypothetical protein